MWEDIIKKVVLLVIADGAKELIKFAKDKVDPFIKWWSGKCIAVIGPTASGKNSLFRKLRRLEAPTEHIQTRGAEKIDTFKFHWPLPDKTFIEFRCRNAINVGGEIDERERFWLESTKNADVIFYLVDLEKLLEVENYKDSDAINRIKSDFKWMATNIPNFKAASSIHILINKIDVLTTDSEISDIQDKLEQISELIRHLEDLARGILGLHFDKVSGLSPISMIDGYIFSNYFTQALKSIFNSQSTKK